MNRTALRTKTSRSTLALALAALLPLAACGDGRSEADRAADKAAAPLSRAFEALGVRGARWTKANLDGTAVVLRDLRADMDGVGTVRIGEVTVRGFLQTDTGWQADLVVADGVEGAARARRASVQSPRASRVAGEWSVQDGGRFLDAYEGPLAGGTATMRTAGWGPAPVLPGRHAGTQVAAAGLRLEGASGTLAALSGLDWDVSVRSEPDGRGGVSIELQRAEATGWSLRGRISIAGGPGLVSALAALDPASVLDARRWPADALLREADLDVTMARPGAVLGASASDPVAGSLAAQVAAGGPVSWHVRMAPPNPVPVRDLPAILANVGADSRLGLQAQSREVLIPSRGDMPQSSAAALPPPAPNSGATIPRPANGR